MGGKIMEDYRSINEEIKNSLAYSLYIKSNQVISDCLATNEKDAIDYMKIHINKCANQGEKYCICESFNFEDEYKQTSKLFLTPVEVCSIINYFEKKKFKIQYKIIYKKKFLIFKTKEDREIIFKISWDFKK